MAIVLGVSTCPPGARRPSCLDASGGAARRSPDPVRRSVFHSGLSFCGQGVIFIFESFRLSGSTWERSLWNGRLDVIKRLIVRTLPIRGDLL
jgi:hypothetical protein